MSFGGDFSVEGVVKLQPFHKGWSALIAGSDVSQAPLVLARASRLLKGKSSSLFAVQTGFKQAYQEQLRERVTDEFLSSFNMTLEDFKRKARRQLEPNLFQSLSFGIKNAKLGCRFLIYGFDEKARAHLFEIGENGKLDSRDKPGFWAIGSGAVSALSTLANLKQASEATPLNATIYNVLAAKYTSESASDVGPETFFFVLRSGSIGFRQAGPVGAVEQAMRQLWESKGRPRTPPEVADIVNNAHIEFLYSTRPTRSGARRSR